MSACAPAPAGKSSTMSISRCCGACAIFCLLQLGCARDPLAERIAGLNDPDVGVRRTSARGFCEQPAADERAIAALAKSAADADVEVRSLAIAALGKAGSVAAPSLPVVRSALEDPEKRVRLEAALAMSKIDPRDASARPVLIAAMREGEGRTLLAIGTMGADGTWAVPTLVGLLSHEAPQVRALAAKTLGSIGPTAKDAAAALQAAQRDSNAAVRTTAKKALDRIQTGSARK